MVREHIVKSYDEELERLKTMVAEMGAAAMEQITDAIDKIYADLFSRIRGQLEQEHSTTKDDTSLIYAARCCERIGDHVTNMAENIYYIQRGVLYNDGAAKAL